MAHAEVAGKRGRAVPYSILFPHGSDLGFESPEGWPVEQEEKREKERERNYSEWVTATNGQSSSICKVNSIMPDTHKIHQRCRGGENLRCIEHPTLFPIMPSLIITIFLETNKWQEAQHIQLLPSHKGQIWKAMQKKKKTST